LTPKRNQAIYNAKSYALGKATQTPIRVAFLLEHILHKLLVIDNYDSFTFNLVQMFMAYDLDIHVHRCDQITLAEAKSLAPDYILISPGPGNPSQSGISCTLIKSFYQDVPILGVCLGMQCINEVFDGKTARAPLPMHGKTSEVSHNNEGIFRGLTSPFAVARYHSLMVEPACESPLVRTALTNDGVIMGISHPRFPLHGIQFHPESFMTEQGALIIKNFLETKGGVFNG
jgi:anthranilate synthase component II